MNAAVAAGISGLGWGFLGAFLTRNVAGVHFWLAATGGPLIGVAVYCATRWTYWKSAWFLIPTAIGSTILAVGMFGIGIGLADLARDIPNRGATEVVLQSMIASLYGLLLMPPFWTLFLLSALNHMLLRHLERRNSRSPGVPLSNS